MAQINLYYQTQLETKVSLLPNQIDQNMDNYLLENLKAKVERKTIDVGIVMRVNKIVDYDYGMIDKSNFMGTVVYNVKYECLICSPTKNIEIICVLDNIIKGYLIGRNGPVIVAIEFNNIDTQKFEVSGNTIIHIKTKRQIKKGDYLKVSIININNNMGEPNIVTICKLINFAENDEIKKFEEDQRMINNESSDGTNEFI
ncbi:MAG: hypothetical protein QW303_00800 [Nitrososphaerota archaeon]